MKQFYLTCLFIFFFGIFGKAQLLSQAGVNKFKENTTAESYFLSRFQTDAADNNLSQINNIHSNSYNAPFSRSFYIEFPYQGVSKPMQSITDNEGNTYITGTSSHEEAPAGNMLTMKVNPEGEILWMTRENVVDFASEFGFAISLDAENNPVVAGVEWNGSDMDIRTVKYDKSSGASIWKSIFDGGFSGLDYPSQITVDNQGNVLVLGISYVNNNEVESVNYTILKYNSEGNLLWSKIEENDVEGIWIEPSAISSDNNGNIAVVGYGSNENFYQTYYTIKYSADGEILWKQNYLFTIDGNQTNSVANDVAFDNDGNCYVTGTFATGSPFSKMGTIKYSPEGEEIWVDAHEIPNRMNYGYELKTDNDKIYVAGMHRTSSPEGGSILISYDPDGNQNWVKETSNLQILGSGLGTYVHLEFDSQKNPVVAVRGQNEESKHAINIMKYDEQGELIDEKNYVKELTGIFVVNGLIGLGISENDDYTIVMDNRYTEEGNVYEFTQFNTENDIPEWNNFYGNMGGSNTSLTDALPDEFGNTIIIGNYGSITESISYMQNFFLAKYSPSGDILWQHSFNPDNGNPATRIMMDINSAGETIVALTSSPFDSNPIFVKKYSVDGELIWEFEKTFIQPEINTITIDDNDNIFIAGNTHEFEDQYSPRFTVIKISDDGNEQWTKWISSGNEEDNLYYISKAATDSMSNITFSGHSGAGSFFSQTTNLTTFQLSQNGELNWINASDITGWNSGANNLYVDEQGQAYAVGWKENKTNINLGELLIYKYSPEGDLVWGKSYGQTGRRVRSYAVKPLSTGELIVTGFSVLDGTNNRVVTLKFDEEGDLEWEVNSDFNEFYRDVYVDDLDNIYVLNQVYSTTHPRRIYFTPSPFTINGLMKISPDGNVEEEFFIAPQYSDSNPDRLVPLHDGRLLLGNTISSEISHFSGIYFFTSSHEVLGSNDSDMDSNRNKLGQNYPNPATEQTQIPFHITESGKVSIRLYDSTGRYIKELTNRYFTQGENSISVNLNGLSSGIYFYQMNASGFKQARKIIIK
ncbi:T9SS type A sorting domain-containing protein [Moheibacter sediminis]|uniref:Por secretion system C-terminal sorting domain-containing protein n=1 Tax=Moheibacter sediminis TaxID=1434700 RepID=A0A1W2CHS4_9FLAO|nr:T9SS type A sorting domain-containing protein [Moheibacter sediminis]SMC84753.1 Por secretion system C-terminal sorting domain-containing protein [Moheibacter sediminis]